VTPPTDVDALRALLARAPEPGNLRWPNAVSAFFSRWRQWRGEAEALVAQLERAAADQPTAARRRAAGGPGDAAPSAPVGSVSPRRPSPAQVNVVVEEITAEQGGAPSAPAVVARLRQRFGVSRATAYRALETLTREGSTFG
jgi:hypothetical protein